MRWVRLAAPAAISLSLLCGTASAGPEPKQNGDSSSDLAPLDTSGTSATEGPLAKANTPPIGGATQGGGGNPKESGPIDAARASKPNNADKSIQPDNK